MRSRDEVTKVGRAIATLSSLVATSHTRLFRPNVHKMKI